MPVVPLKFIKTLNTSGTMSSSEAGQFFVKLLYEFWGFCVNGSDDLTVPGGFATSGISVPDGFESGSTTLWAQGNDGQTSFATNVFHSDQVDFTLLDHPSGSSPGQLIGKHLVTWKSGSTSTDDSVYPIIGIDDQNNSINVEVQVGGTRRLGNKAFFSQRSGINFRIIDPYAAKELDGWADGNGLVLQFNAAADVNPDQAASQARVSLSDTQQSITLTISPSGSWSGSSFSDGTSGMTSNWFYTNASGFGAFVMIGGRDSLIVSARGIDGAWSNANSSGLHIEVPKRLYSSAVDPNPVAFISWANRSLSQLAENYADFQMVGADGVVRSMITLARCPWGDHIDTSITPTSGGLLQGFSNSSNSRFLNFNYNPFSDSFFTSDAVLGCAVTGQFSLARARLRRVRFTSNNQSKGFRFGDIDWVFVSNGVLWPWDNTSLGYSIQPEGL